MELRCSLLLVILLFSDISFSAAPSCKAGCVGQNNNALKLQEGTTYVYQLEGDTETSIPKATGPNGETTKLGIRAKVEVNVQAQCAALIRLKNVQIIGPDDKKYKSLTKLEQNPLRVSLNGGALSSQACAVPDDDYISLNIKRAVISLLQINSLESKIVPQEVDVFGSCPTQYDVRQDGDVTVVLKTRELNTCAYRENIRQEIFSVPSAGNSELQSSPLLDPTYEAEIRVKGGIVEQAIARESYLLRPFSDKSKGARTKITTKISFESKATGSIADTTKEPRSIIFENPHEVVSSSIQSVLAALHKVADNTVGIDAANNVAELVAIIRRASADDLLSVYGQVKAGAGFKNKNLAKKVFTDALFRSGSGDSIAVAIELLKSREIQGNDAKLWFLSFGLARHASSSALEKAADLLGDDKLPKEAYLGIGALAGKYCREHFCEGVPQFEQLLNKLAVPLAKPIPASRTEETKYVGSLKALRNVKHLTEDVASKVAAIIKESEAPTRVRVAALETAVSDACKAKFQKAAADILNNREEDSELRIKAYLVLVECPSPKTANKLSELLETETVNQVGAFITAHLRNLRATAKPDRQAARLLLENVKPRRRFPFDIRKFSQNYELSYDIDALSSSASVDSNIIFSQKSYLPRSANLNLTAEVFGHAFNLFEISGRAENLERVIERVLGPKGYLRNTKPEDIFRDGKSELLSLKKHLEDKYQKLSRPQRSVSHADINNFRDKVKLRSSELDNNLDVDISLRLLGNELLWLDLGEKQTSPEAVIDKVAAALDKGFGKVKDFDQNIQNHAVFLDTELAYPTSSGLPLKLTATGTSVVHVKLAGSIDLPAILKDPKNGQAKLEIRPSASVEVVGQLSVDGYAVEAGVKLAATLHTATGSEVSIKMLDGQGIDLNIGLPVKESDILTISTEVLQVVRERGQPQINSLLNFQIPRKDYQGCFDQLLPVIGLTLCGKVGFPNDPAPLTSNAALYPLNGHSKVSLRLDKEDESLTSYHFRLQYNLYDPKHRRIEAFVETPGSKNPREIRLFAEAKTTPNKEVNLELITPIYKFKAQAKLTDTDSEYSLSGLAELEGIFSYKARLGLLINGATYTPLLEYTPADGSTSKSVNVQGSVTVDKAGSKRTYTFKSVRVVTAQGQVSVDGTITKDVNQFGTDLKIGYDKGTVGVKSLVHRSGQNLKLQLEVSPSQYPDFGIGVKYEYQYDKNHVENNLVIVHGNDLTSQKHKLSIFQQITFNVESYQRFDISTKNTLTYPLFSVDAKLEGAATQKSVHYDLFLGYDKNTIKSKLNAKTGITKPGDYDIDFSAAVLDRGVKFEAKREIVAANKSKFNNNLLLTPGGKYSLDAEVTHQLDKHNIDTRLLISAKLEGSPNPYKLDIGLVVNPSNLAAHSKIALGSSELLDAEVKQKRVEPSSGSFRFNLRNALQSNGEYRRTEAKTSANILIEIIPISRKIKGTADLTVTGPKHVGTIEILYNADKEPSKKLLIQTETDLGVRSINSKNKIDASGREFIVNFNGEATGKVGNGGVSGGYDITLPTGLHLVARGKQAINIVPGNSNGELFLELGYSTKKETPLTKLTLNTQARNVDFKRYAFDTKYELLFSCESGDAYYKQSISSLPQDGKLLVEAHHSFGGSRLGEYQYNGKIKATASKSEVTYHVSASLGQKYSVDAQGKVFPGTEDKNYGIEQTLVITTPVESAKEIKLLTTYRYVLGDDTRPCHLKLIEELTYNGKFSYKLSAEGQISKKEGQLRTSLVLPGDEPYTAQIKYKHNQENDVNKSEVSLDSAQGDKKLNLNLKADYTKSLALVNARLIGATPFPSAKTIDIGFNYKKVSSTSVNADLKFNLNNDQADIVVKYDFTTNHIFFDLGANVNGAKYRTLYKIDKKSNRHGTAEGQLVWAHNGGGQYDWSGTFDLESLENFLIVLKLNSEKLKINNVRVEIGNRPNKSGTVNKVNFAAENKDGKIFSGSASYVIKENEHGYTIEGKGTMTVDKETFPLSYKISDSRLLKNVNNEEGREFSTNIDFGQGTYNQHLKVTKEVFRYNQKTCWEKKCHESVLLSSFSRFGLSTSENEFLFKLSNNLPHFPSYKLEVSSNGRRDGLLGSSETKVTLQDSTYALKTYVNTADAGVIVTVPTREIAAVAEYNFGRKQDEISTKVEASLYLDRQKNAADKASLLILGSLKNQKDVVNGVATAKFTHPSISRDLTVKGEVSLDLKNKASKANLEVDVLSKKSQKIILTAEAEQNIVDNGRNFTAKAGIISKGLVLDIGASAHAYGNKDGASSVGAFAYYVDDKNIKKDAGALLTVSPKKLSALLKVPGHTLVEGEARITTGTDVKTVDAELTLAEGDTALFTATVTGLREIKATLKPKSNPKRSLNGLLSLTPEKFEVRSERIDGGKTELLFFGIIRLDNANLFKLDYDIQIENIKKSVKYFENLVKDIVDRIRAIAESLGKEINTEITNLTEAVKKAHPNLKALIQQYETAFKAIREELEKDKNYQLLADVFKKIFGGSLDTIQSQIKIILTTYEKIIHEVTELQDKIAEIYKKVSPDVIEAYRKLLGILSEVTKKLLDIGLTAVDQLLEIIRQNEKDLKLVINNVAESFQDIGRITIKSFNQLRNEIQDFVKLLLDQLKSLPAYNNAKERLKELVDLELPPHIFDLLQELSLSVQDFLPTPELKELAKVIFSYIEKHLKRLPVDDVAELKAISSQAATVVEQLIRTLKDNLGLTGVDTTVIPVFGFNVPIPRPANAVLRLPEFGNIRFSPLSLLAAINELPTPLELYFTYRPTYNPLDQVPPFRAYSIILNSHHFFTFDKKHFAFKGSCSYVLAQDFQDGNFSLVANLENGKIKSLAISDKTNVVELLADNTVLVNGEAGEFPVHIGEIDGWRRYNSVNIKLKAGVHVTRYIPLDLYVIRVSGFYFGRTRGLLGTINNEQYDEFVLPNGHITESISEFGNAYQLTKCSSKQEHKHNSAHASDCTSFFTSDSSLRNYFNILSPEPYREACDQHVGMVPAAAARKAACEVATAYVTALRQEGTLFASIPSECAQCSVSGKKIELGQSEQITSPVGKADVVLVIEQSTHNEAVFKDLVTPLIATLSTDLKERGLSDVEFALIGYGGPNMSWPQHYGNKGKVTYDGKSDNIKFGDSERLTPPYDNYLKKIQYIKKFIDIELGREQIVIAMTEANNYPFRQGAAKIIILINSAPCLPSPIFPISLQTPRTINIYRYYREHGLNFFIVSPLAGLGLENGKPKTIVGFDSEKVYYLSEKKNIEGKSEDRAGLTYEDDLCLSFSQYYGGAAFSSQNLVDAKPEQKKKFVEVVSQRIVNGAVKYSLTEDCACTLQKGLLPVTECTVAAKALKGR